MLNETYSGILLCAVRIAQNGPSYPGFIRLFHEHYILFLKTMFASNQLGS
jgi:hypothetical protein